MNLSRELFAEQYEKIKTLDAEIKAQDQRINRLCNANDRSKPFLDVPGVGPLTIPKKMDASNTCHGNGIDSRGINLEILIRGAYPGNTLIKINLH